MTDRIVIRDLEPEDVEALVEIALAAWAPVFAYYHQEMGEALFAAELPDWRAKKARQIREACQPESQAYGCVAEVDGEPVGFCTFYTRPSSGVGEIGNNAVHPDWQGRGIAPQMYRHAFDRLRALGMRYVKVSTGGDPSHAPARRAYVKVGFDVSLPGVTYYREL